MQVIKHYYFPFFVGIALIVYAAQQFAYPLPMLINNYGNDLLCMPIVLKICQYAVRFIQNDEQLVIPLKIGFTLTVLYSIYFEWILPQYNERYTSDGMDVVCYFLGLLFFIGTERIPINHSLKSR